MSAYLYAVCMAIIPPIPNPPTMIFCNGIPLEFSSLISWLIEAHEWFIESIFSQSVGLNVFRSYHMPFSSPPLATLYLMSGA